MPCYHPITAWRARTVNPSGKRGLVFSKSEGFEDMEVQIPCGHCWGCRLDHSYQWAVRCMHEASLHQNNCFITLTYDNEHLPADRGLHLEHFQDFFKRLRSRFTPRCPFPSGHPERESWLKKHTIKYYHSGEYGEKFARPHYHACLFNFDFPDKVFFKTLPSGFPVYVSDTLTDLWPYGFHTIGGVTFESAAYVARYVMKKRTGTRPFVAKDPYTGEKREYENSLEFYEQIDYETGEITYRKPEYSTMSRRPGIAKGWYDLYKGDCFPHDYVMINGKKSKVPKYYLNQFELENSEEFRMLKLRRKAAALLRPLTSDRLEVMEKVKLSRTKYLVRPYEQEKSLLVT